MPTTARGRDPAAEEEFLGALYKGGELLASGKIVEARAHLEKAHGLEPKNEKAQNLLGLTYFKLGLFDQASAVYEQLVNENPTDATLRVNLGLVYLKTNNLERCIKEFETATDLEPTHKKAHNYLGLALAQQGTYAKAKEHFELAGSDQMAEKMGRAIANQSSPSGMHQAVPPPPRSVVLGETPPPVAAAPPRAEEEPIEVMSDEELPSDAYVVPEELVVTNPPSTPGLNSDWGAELKPSAPEEAAPVEELPVVDAVVEASPSPAHAPAWLTMEAAEAARAAPAEETAWVTEGVADVPLDAPPEATDPRWDTQPPEASQQAAAEPASAPLEPMPEPVWDSPAAEAAPTAPDAPAADDPSWATGAPAVVAAANDDGAWAGTPDAAPTAPEVAATPEDASWATGDSQEAHPATADDASWATSGAEPAPPATADDASWATGASPAAQPPAADDAAWATGAAQEAQPAPADDAAWATGAEEQALPATADDESWATGAAQETLPATADDASWATGPAQEGQPATADDASWATGAPQEAPPDDATWATGTTEPQFEAASEVVPEQPLAAAAPLPALEMPVTQPAVQPAQLAAPAGYAPMSPQRLVDLGASGTWVHEPSAGPFHISPDGLAVTVAGEMLVRMVGLVAIVGSVQVTPEHRRRRGRPTPEPFGTGPSQLQRVSGNGVLYLEPGRAKFHAVDLTDQNGVAIDDDGAYLREELVFAFEEPISFENGRLSAEGQALELAHLKGNGRVLLQLDGTLRAMPIPLGAPLVVPLHRLVGWFGRVTPRLMGFGGRGAAELTGEGYALLGTPAERG